jgi:GT2 family glycosyltransferase
VRKSIHDTIGGFDDKLAVYTEDLEYSLRIWISGSRIVGAPNSYVYHWTKKVADRKKMHSSKAQIYFHLTKNSFRSIIKNYQLTTLLQYMPFLILITVFRVAQCIIIKDFSSAQSVLKGIFWTIRNLPDTLKVRSTVQSQRKFSDKIISKEVFLRKSLFDIYYEYFAKK